MRTIHAFLLLVVVLVSFFWRPLLLGEIVFPHDNDLELGIPSAKESARSFNRKFSDQSSQYIPELHHQLNGESSGWISTWNPHVELGRPTTHVAAVSKAFWLTRLLSWVSTDAFGVYTWLVMFAMSAASIFAFLLFRAERLHPAACLAGALGIGLGVYATYWATYALFVFGLAWTLAWLWLIRRLLNEWDPLSAFGIIVVVQGLLLTAYPQQIVWHLWFVAVYTLHAAARTPGGLRSCWRALVWIASASAIGVLAAAPVYVDLALDAARSARLDTPLEFFQSVLPRIDGFGEGLQEILQMVDASVFGDPMDPRRMLTFNGVSLTPLYAFGVAASFLNGGVKRLWPLQLFVGFTVLATFSPPVFAFGVDYLGFSLSRFVPITAALIPIAILAAHGFDAALRMASKTLALGIAFSGCLLALVLATHAMAASPLVVWGIGMTAVSMAAVVAFAANRSPVLLTVLAVANVFVYAQPLLLVRPAEAIYRDSPMVRQLRELTDDGSRFAWVGRSIIPANQESLLGLRSIHSYNSISSLAFQRWTRGISERGTAIHGRHFAVIADYARLSPSALRKAGVGVLVATRRLDPEVARPVARAGRLWIHRTREKPIFAAQSTAWNGTGSVELKDSAMDSLLEVDWVSAVDDRVHFETTALEMPSLLFTSWQFHPRWRARSAGRPLETVSVDGFYQGVVLPAGVSTVDFSFEPYVRWAWIPQGCLLVGLSGCVVWKRRRDQGRAHSS